jgi:hypothetical protein
MASGTKKGARKIGIRRKTGSHPEQAGSVSGAKDDLYGDGDRMAKSSQAVNNLWTFRRAEGRFRDRHVGLKMRRRLSFFPRLSRQLFEKFGDVGGSPGGCARTKLDGLGVTP